MILNSIFNKRQVDIPATPMNTATISRVLGIDNKSSAGVSVTPETALGYPALWRGVNIRASTIGRLPLLVMKRVGAGKEIDQKHPAYKLLMEQPNPEQSTYKFKKLLEAHAIMAGSGYAYIVRNDFGQPTELIPLQPENVIPFRENGRLGYSILTDGAMAVELPANIFHVSGLSWDGINGLGATDILRESIGLGLAAQKWQSVFFKNGAAPQTVIELPGSLRNKEAVERFRAMWGKRHKGIDNAHQPALLENGAQLKSFSVSPNDAEMLATREFEIKQVANILGIPAYLLGDSTRTSFASLEVENRTFLRDLQDPLTNWESECYQKLLSDEEKENRTHVIEFDKETIERPDTTTQTQALIAQVNNGIINLDEARDKMNLPPLPDGLGQEYRIPLNLGVIGSEEMPEDDAGMGEEPDEGVSESVNAAVALVLSRDLARSAERIAADAKTRAKHGNKEKYAEWLAAIRKRHEGSVAKYIEASAHLLATVRKEDKHTTHNNIVQTFFATITERYGSAQEYSGQDLPLKVAEVSADVSRLIQQIGR